MSLLATRSRFILLASLPTLVLACSTDEFTGGDAAADAPPDTNVVADAAPDRAPDVEAGPTNFCATDAGAKDAVTCLDFDDLDDKSTLAFKGWTSDVVAPDGLVTLFTPALTFHDGGSPTPPNHLWLRFLQGGSSLARARRARFTYALANNVSTTKLDFDLRVGDPPASNEETEYAAISAAKSNVVQWGLALVRGAGVFTLWVTDSGGATQKTLGAGLSVGWHHVALSLSKGTTGAWSARIDQDSPTSGTADFSAAVDGILVSVGVVNTTPIGGSSVEQNGFYDDVVVHTQ